MAKVEDEPLEKVSKIKGDISKLDVLNVGIVGHIDHGKTTLLERITGKFADSHSEELKRGITIKLGYADTIIYKDGEEYNREKGMPVRYITFVDAPGHEMLMATMLSGAAIIDAAVLVIAANEGIMPQTKEHLLALDAKSVKNIIIVQNKIDLVDMEKAKKNYQIIKDFVKGTVAENSVVIPCSAQQGINIDKIYEELCKIKIPHRDIESKPLFAVARSFDINKPGTEVDKLRGGVLGGALMKGILKIGDEVEIKPGRSYKKENQMIHETIKTKISSLYRGKYSLEKAGPGGSLAIETELDPFLTRSDSLSGSVMGISGELPEISQNISVKFKLFEEVLGIKEKKEVEAIKTPEMLLLSVNTATTLGLVKKIKEDIFEINLRIPIVPFKGNNVGIARNINNHWRLIGFGEIC